MREIKFRAWHDDMAGSWKYGMLVYDEGVPRIQKEGTMLFATCLKGSEGQLTGMKDLHGDDIYEGDICKLNGGAEDVLFAVDFEHGCFVARVPWKLEESPELKYYCGFREDIMTLEVIGNTFETPELLKS